MVVALVPRMLADHSLHSLAHARSALVCKAANHASISVNGGLRAPSPRGDDDQHLLVAPCYKEYKRHRYEERRLPVGSYWQTASAMRRHRDGALVDGSSTMFDAP